MFARIKFFNITNFSKFQKCLKFRDCRSLTFFLLSFHNFCTSRNQALAKPNLDQVFQKFCYSILHKGGSQNITINRFLFFFLLLKRLVSIEQLKCYITILDFIDFDQIKKLSKFWQNSYSFWHETNIHKPDRCFHWFLSSFSCLRSSFNFIFLEVILYG